MQNHIPTNVAALGVARERLNFICCSNTLISFPYVMTGTACSRWLIMIWIHGRGIGIFFNLHKVGITNALQYKLFCSEHDSCLFKDLESRNSIPKSKRDCLLLAFRSACAVHHQEEYRLHVYEKESFIRRLHLGPLCTQRLHFAGQAGKFFTKSLYFEALVRHLFLSSPDTEIWPPSDFCKRFRYCKSRLLYLSKVKTYCDLDSIFIRLT